MNLISDEQGDRPRSLPLIQELKKATDVTERKESPAWDFDVRYSFFSHFLYQLWLFLMTDSVALVVSYDLFSCFQCGSEEIYQWKSYNL